MFALLVANYEAAKKAVEKSKSKSEQRKLIKVNMFSTTNCPGFKFRHRVPRRLSRQLKKLKL